MTTRHSPASRAAAIALSAVLASCAGLPTDPGSTGVEPLFTYPVTANDTPYSRCLAGLGGAAEAVNLPVFGIGEVADKTGKLAADYEGSVLSQGASEMVMSAFFKTGKARLTERFDLRLVNAEIQLAKSRLLERGPATGEVVASDFLVLGAVTELNYNIVSGGVGLWIGGVGAGVRTVVVNVALDLRVIDAKSLEIGFVSTLQKQIVGYEVEANVFRFFDAMLVELDAGQMQNEPLQLGLRTVVEMAVYQVMTEYLGLPAAEACAPRPADHIPTRPL